MSMGVAVALVVICFGSLLIGFARSMYRQRERRQEVKRGWSSTPGSGGSGHGAD